MCVLIIKRKIWIALVFNFPCQLTLSSGVTVAFFGVRTWRGREAESWFFWCSRHCFGFLCRLRMPTHNAKDKGRAICAAPCSCCWLLPRVARDTSALRQVPARRRPAMPQRRARRASAAGLEASHRHLRGFVSAQHHCFDLIGQPVHVVAYRGMRRAEYRYGRIGVECNGVVFNPCRA